MISEILLAALVSTTALPNDSYIVITDPEMKWIVDYDAHLACLKVDVVDTITHDSTKSVVCWEIPPNFMRQIKI